MAKSYTNLSNECISKFDQKRFNPISIDKNEWQFNPISKTIGGFSKRNFSQTQKSLIDHDFTGKLRESGYTNNLATMDKKGWVPNENLNSNKLK
jgi:hypothetical protein